MLRALFQAYFIDLIRKTGRSYTSCFPPVKTNADLDRNSLFAKVRAPTKYAFYSQLKSIFGRSAFGFVSKVPPALIDDLKKNAMKLKYLEYCFKAMPKQNNRRKDNRRKDSKYRKKSGKSYKRSGKSRKRSGKSRQKFRKRR